MKCGAVPNYFTHITGVFSREGADRERDKKNHCGLKLASNSLGARTKRAPLLLIFFTTPSITGYLPALTVGCGVPGQKLKPKL